MKTTLILTILTFCTFGIYSQTQKTNYDKALADSLGANEYGMKSYVLVILKTGPTKIEDKAISDSLFKGHMANIKNLADKGKLVVAGPISKNEKMYRGIFILNVSSLEEANELLLTDPAIKAKVFETESFIWFGSAALPLYLKSHSKIEKNRM
jgi:uncharacterized protein YciI